MCRLQILGVMATRLASGYRCSTFTTCRGDGEQRGDCTDKHYSIAQCANTALDGGAQAQAFAGSAFAEPRCNSSKVCKWMQHFHMQGSEGAGGQGEQSERGQGNKYGTL